MSSSLSYANPLSVSIPNQFPSQADFPTEIIANRFQAYRSWIKDLVLYFRQYASVQEEIVRQQVRLQQAVAVHQPTVASPNPSSRSSHKHSADQLTDAALINQFFLPVGNGSLLDIPNLLSKFHLQNIQNGTKLLKEINLSIIPKLEDLRRDLLVKIKEIKNLQNDFKNSLTKEVSETKSLLNTFSHAIDVANRFEIPSSGDLHHESGSDVDSTKKDPYLVKLRLDRQLKRQLVEETYLYDAFKNLQTSAEKLESIVVLEIQNWIKHFLNAVQVESSTVPNFLVSNFTEGFLAKEANFEWDSFISRNLPQSSSISNNMVSGKFIDLSFPARKFSDLKIPHHESLVNVAVRSGELERRSKFLKSYSRGWYVLTCSYIHEFKSPDRKKDPNPIMSLSLDFCSVSEHSKNDGKMSGNYKFVLYSKLHNGLIHRGHNWVFRCSTYNEMIEWYKDIETLTGLASPSARARAMSKKLQVNDADKHLSRTSSAAYVRNSGLRSIKSSQSSVRNLSKQNSRVTAAPSNIGARSKLTTGNESGEFSGQNQRLSSTFSQMSSDSPKLSNLINSDGTIVTPVVSRSDRVTANGDITVALSKPTPDETPQGNPSNATKEFSTPAAQGAFPFSPSAYPVTSNPSQNQTYNYGIPQVQQFYDPVLQQFFTINAIPAAQVPHMDYNQQLQQTNSTANAQPMPQYFPSLPQVSGAGQPVWSDARGPGSPNLNNSNGADIGTKNAAPYPVKLGDGFETSSQTYTPDDEPLRVKVPNGDVEDKISKLSVAEDEEK